MTPNLLTTASLFAQSEAAGITAKAAGLGAQLAAGLLAIAVAWVAIPIYWKLLVAMFKEPNYGTLIAIVAPLLFAIFLIGAAGDMADLAYDYGQSFLDGGQ